MTSFKTKREIIDSITEFLVFTDSDTIARLASQISPSKVVVYDGDLFEVTEED